MFFEVLSFNTSIRIHIYAELVNKALFFIPQWSNGPLLYYGGGGRGALYNRIEVIQVWLKLADRLDQTATYF